MRLHPLWELISLLKGDFHIKQQTHLPSRSEKGVLTVKNFQQEGGSCVGSWEYGW